MALYNGIQRANDVIRTLRLSPSISPSDTVEYEAEARFLRGYFHFEGKKIFNNFPYVNELIQYSAGNLDVPNSVNGNYINIWPDIEADLSYAANNLPGTQPNIGRVNKWAAMAFLAKAYMYQHQYDSALTLLTTGDQPVAPRPVVCRMPSNPIMKAISTPLRRMAPKAFLPARLPSTMGHPHPPMAGMAIRAMSSISHTTTAPAAAGSTTPPGTSSRLTRPMPPACLYLDGSYNNNPLINDPVECTLGRHDGSPARLGGRQTRRALFRLGHDRFHLGSRPRRRWSFRSQKERLCQEPAGTYSSTETVFWGAAEDDANNVNLCRFADVILWAAECEAQTGNLDQAETYVNMIRQRAANPNGWVYLNATYNASTSTYSPQTTPGANYLINPYPAGAFTAQGQTYALNAIEMERRLELGMEGQRFFDLARWDNGTGTMAATLNAYVNVEKNRTGFYRVNNTAFFTKGVNECFALPLNEIQAENATGKVYLVQNPGYQ